MVKAYLLTGGNMGNRLEYLRTARELIEEEAGLLKAASSIYETAAWGKTDQAPFLNQVLLIETNATAAELMSLLLSIEEKMGRRRKERYGERIIDIDILLFGEEVCHSDHVTIPHPELPARRFALIPLAEIAPDLVHPTTGKTIAQLLLSCKDPLPVHKI